MKVKILILDDDEELIASLSRLLSRDYDISGVTTIDAALEQLNKSEYSVCLLDQNLHDSLKGLEFAQILKNNFPYTQIIMLTGESNPELVISAINSEVIDAFLVKPYEYKELKKYIDDNIKIWKERKQAIHEIIERIETGKIINSQQVIHLRKHLNYIEELLFDSVKSSGENSFSCIGLVLYQNQEIIYQQFHSEEFSVKNDTLFVGLIETLSHISGELFTGTEGKIETIKMKNISLKVKVAGSLTAVMFTIGEVETTIFNVEFKNFIARISDMFGDTILRIDDHTRNMIDAELQAFDSHFINL